MLKKWKSILLNWINCYFTESGKNEENVQVESLHIIISHLRESFNLDESKSSILGARTVEEFLLEKYPEFKFVNGTVEARNEDEVCIAASLLLFFVCVNSKEVDIKNAMCSRLSREDQEIILKFSKNLMECSPIFCRDVQAAITEACGKYIVPEATRSQLAAADTPPVLRSLHSEVRRLQAALDAEQFDRNYLQEELSRTNLRVEQLKKDKEQYKLDIVNLKAKLTQCSRQEEEVSNSETDPDHTTKLIKELQEIEHQLIQTQAELNDVVSDRDIYKSKVEELKKDRDKWLTLSQKEASQVTQLTEELETERHNATSLKELIRELQLHNKLNRVDSSLLECDDPDTSIQSFQRNSSVCSEACTNVIELQLGEERAKITVLEEQIKILQDQIKDLNEKYVTDKKTYETNLNERETDNLNLKHCINEEIEEKSNLKAYFDNEVIKLNNDINELEQRLKGNNENSRSIIERKMQEIKILQEEKLSLLQNLTDETTKNEKIFKCLREEIDWEKRSKSNMRDGYENQIMKLNEKILNRNNEVVELQNNILEKSEIIESLYFDLRKQKEMREEESRNCHSDLQQLNEQKTVIEQYLQQKSNEVAELKTIAEQKIIIINDLQKEMSNLKLSLSNMKEEYKYLEDTKEKVLIEIHNRDIKLKEMHKDIDSLKKLFSEEKEKLTHDLGEKNATINALKKQLQDEIHYKISIQNEFTHLQKINIMISEELKVAHSEVSVSKSIIQKKDETIREMDIYLQKEKENIKKLVTDHDTVSECLNKVTEDMNKKEIEINSLNGKHENYLKGLEDQLHHKEKIIEIVNEKLKIIMAENGSLQEKNSLINNEKFILEKDIVEKNEKIMQLEADRENRIDVIQEDKLALEQKLMQTNKKYKELEKSFDTETSKMIAKLNQTEKTIKELSTNSKNTIRNKELQIQKLSLDQDNATKIIQNLRDIVSKTERERDALVQKLDEEVNYKNNFEKEYQNQCLLFDRITAQLNEEVGKKNEEVNGLKTKIASLGQITEEKNKDIQLIKDKMIHEVNALNDLVVQKNIEIKDIVGKLSDVESLNSELEHMLQQEKDHNIQVLEVLRKENEQLHFITEEENSNHEVLLKEKDNIIDSIEQKIKNGTAQLECIRKNYEDLTLNVEKSKLESQEKEEKIGNLMQEIIDLKKDHNKIEKANHRINDQVKKISKEKEEVELQLKSRMSMLQETLSITEEKYGHLVKEKDNIVLQYNEEKALRACLELEKDNLSHENMKIFDDKKQLCNAKAILMQELLEQKSTNKMLEEYKNRLLEEKNSLEEGLAEVVKIKDALLEEKDCLTQQLIEKKSAIELLVKEKENLFKENNILAQQLITGEENNYKDREDLKKISKKHTDLNEEYLELKAEKQTLENKLESLNVELKKENSLKNEIFKVKQSLIFEKDSLEHEIIKYKAINDALLTDKGLLLLEKEALAKSLGDKTSALDKVENEKNTLRIIIEDMCKKHELELIKKIEELRNRTEEVTHLKIDCEDQKHNNDKISMKLNTALDKLIQNLKKQEINIGILQEILVDNISEITSCDKCDFLINIADTLTTELSMRNNLDKALEHENSALNELRDMCKQKEIQILSLQTDVKRLEQIIHEQKLESLKQAEIVSTTVNSKVKDIQILEKENETLTNNLNDVKFQLEIKVHSLKEKLTDNENLTDKLKQSYESQIDNLNLMINKLTNYLKDKSIELEAMRKVNEDLQQTVDNNIKVIKSLEDEVKIDKQNQEKLISDFESEHLVLKNMITVTESVMEDQKVSLNNIISQHMKANAILLQEKESLKEAIEKEKDNLTLKIKQKDAVLETILNDLSNIKEERDKIRKDVAIQHQSMINEVNLLKDELDIKIFTMQALETGNNDKTELKKYKEDVDSLEKQNNELKIKIDLIESEKQNRVEDLTRLLDEQTIINKDLEITLEEKINYCQDVEKKVEQLTDEINNLVNEKNNIELEYKKDLARLDKVNVQLNIELENLNKEIEHNNTELIKLKQQAKDEMEQNVILTEDIRNDKMALIDKCSILQDYQVKAEELLEERQKEIILLRKEIDTLMSNIGICQEDLIAKDGFISKISREKDEIINTVRKELSEEKSAREKVVASYMAAISAKQNMEDNLVSAVGQPETCLLQDQDKKNTKPCSGDDDRLLHQVDNTSTDFAQSSTDSLKTISDLEKILDDKNRKITTLQSDITHLRSILAESETQLIDVRVELDMSKENCQQLSSQLKKIVHQKNEEIAELKRQINKMSVTENRATQIIKVSAKYQAIILKKIAEIKSNTVLKELTNLGNSNSCDELRRNLPGSVTMEDLENFLETTDRHLKRCAEKQASLQKERDRLNEVNRINESEVINLRKYLTEISLSYQTFHSVKDMYAQKLSRVLSIQRTVRREIFNLDGHITPASMCKLERGYAAIMQDLSECTMNLERWVERCIAQTVTPEKIKQVLLVSCNEPVSLSCTSLQNTSLEVQIEELGNSFQKLLEEAARSSKRESAVDAQAITVTEVRAEYEDKLNRMKSKMNQLYHEQIGVFKEKQREEIALLKRELQKTRDKLAKSSEEYEEHIRKLTVELWRVGQKFVEEKAEADDLRRKNRSGSLMSLQHVHSSGLAPTLEEIERPSDTYSLRSLPLDVNAKREGRDLHMSDEGEVFDNRCLKELSATPRRDAREFRDSQPPGLRLSELRWRNSLCPPHLKSSYPAETQFAQAIDEEDIKCAGSMAPGKQQRKEVGITAYKKPGPPTPSKQAGRLSATGSELRESLRVEADPHASRKTSTPSRLRSFFRSSRHETNEGTPRSRKLSGFFRKM